VLLRPDLSGFVNRALLEAITGFQFARGANSFFRQATKSVDDNIDLIQPPGYCRNPEGGMFSDNRTLPLALLPAQSLAATDFVSV
jgi:hypothetical protein